jgi:hypothetical protein
MSGAAMPGGINVAPAVNMMPTVYDDGKSCEHSEENTTPDSRALDVFY